MLINLLLLSTKQSRLLNNQCYEHKIKHLIKHIIEIITAWRSEPISNNEGEKSEIPVLRSDPFLHDKNPWVGFKVLLIRNKVKWITTLISFDRSPRCWGCSRGLTSYWLPLLHYYYSGVISLVSAVQYLHQIN